MFASGILILGLCLLAQAIVGDEVGGAAVAGLPVAGALFLMGLLMWPVMTFYTIVDDAHARARQWAQVMMLAGAAHLGLASGKAQSKRLAAACRSRSPSRARRADPRVERVALLALGLRPPPRRVAARPRRDLPARERVPPPLVRLQRRLRAL
jgi:hypothetical protein